MYTIFLKTTNNSMITSRKDVVKLVCNGGIDTKDRIEAFLMSYRSKFRSNQVFPYLQILRRLQHEVTNDQFFHRKGEEQKALISQTENWVLNKVFRWFLLRLQETIDYGEKVREKIEEDLALQLIVSRPFSLHFGHVLIRSGCFSEAAGSRDKLLQYRICDTDNKVSIQSSLTDRINMCWPDKNVKAHVKAQLSKRGLDMSKTANFFVVHPLSSECSQYPYGSAIKSVVMDRLMERSSR